MNGYNVAVVFASSCAATGDSGGEEAAESQSWRSSMVVDMRAVSLAVEVCHSFLAQSPFPPFFFPTKLKLVSQSNPTAHLSSSCSSLLCAFLHSKNSNPSPLPSVLLSEPEQESSSIHATLPKIPGTSLPYAPINFSCSPSNFQNSCRCLEFRQPQMARPPFFTEAQVTSSPAN